MATALAPVPASLTPAERRAWEEDGFFLRPAAFGGAELAPLRGAVERVAARLARAAGATPAYRVDGHGYAEVLGATVQYEHRPGARSLRVIEPFHHLDPRLDALVDDPRLVEPARALVGAPELALFTAKLNLKRPRDGSRFRWHQDSPYWAEAGRDAERMPNVLLALDDAGEENGCLRVVRGSHRRGILPGGAGPERLAPLYTDAGSFDEAEQVPAVMPAGSLLFFHAHAVHGSSPNRSARPRRALVLTYQPGGRPLFRASGVRAAGGPSPSEAPPGVASEGDSSPGVGSGLSAGQR